MTALRGAAVVGLLATHALAGQQLNATTAVNYGARRGRFQKVREFMFRRNSVLERTV